MMADTVVHITVEENDEVRQVPVTVKNPLGFLIVDTRSNNSYGPFQDIQTALDLAAKWEREYADTDTSAKAEVS